MRARLLLLIPVMTLLSAATISLADPLPHPKAEDNLTRLYQVLKTGTPDAGLLVDPVNDSVSYAQFYPDEKFEIYRRGNEYYVPLAIWTGDEDCEQLAEYIETDTTQRFARASRARYVVPMGEIEDVLNLDCVQNLENEPGVRIMTFEERGNLTSTYYVWVYEDYETGELVLDTWTRGDLSGVGWEVKGTVKKHRIRDLLIVQPFLSNSTARPSRKTYPAHGIIRLTPPSGLFHLQFGADVYMLSRGKDSLTVQPLKVVDNLLLPPSQERFPANMFGLAFGRFATLESFQEIPERLIPQSEIVAEAELEQLISKFEQIGARPIMVDEMQVSPETFIRREGTVNYLDTATTFRKWTSRPILLFGFDGDMAQVQAVYDALTDRPGEVTLFRRRW